MVNEYTKSNTGKLLAAIVAMLMVVCAVAVVAMPSEAADVPTYTMDDTDEADKVIVYQPESGNAEYLTLAEAMAKLQDDSVTGGTMTFPAGNYDVYDTVSNMTGSAFVVKASGITVQAAEGAAVLIYTSKYVTAGTEITDGINTIQGQSAITINGNNSTRAMPRTASSVTSPTTTRPPTSPTNPSG